MNNITNNNSIETVVAASVSAGRWGLFRAVMLRKRAGGFELVWKKATQNSQAEWETFIQETQVGRQRSDGCINVIALDSAPVAFYRIKAPPVEDNQLDAIVRMQSESLLPLPVEQMQTAWRSGGISNGKRNVTLAAAKTSALDQFVALGRSFRASEILLDCQGLVKAWQVLFGRIEKEAVIVHIQADNTQVIFVERGQLTHAVRLGQGSDELSNQLTAQAARELFVHDLRNAIELFDIGEATKVEVSILSGDMLSYSELIGDLVESRINAHLVVPDTSLLNSSAELTTADVCDYIEVIGTAMLALDGGGDKLNLFDGLYLSPELEAKRKPELVLKRKCVVAAVMVVLLLLVSYGITKARLEHLDKHMNSSSEDSDKITAAGLIEQQKARKTIAEQRPNILDLLTKINESRPADMLLDSFNYQKKEKKVTIAGTAKSREQLYDELEKPLKEKSGITNVKIINATSDKDNKVSFKITFDYGKPGK